jgi:dipeptidyl-peptidase-4
MKLKNLKKNLKNYPFNMLKKTFLFIFIFHTYYAFNQVKKTDLSIQELTLENSVLSYYNGLYPRTLSGLKWTENNTISHRNDSTLFIQKPTTTRAKEKHDLAYLNKIYPGITKMPYFNSISDNYISFFKDNKFINIDISKQASSIITTPKSAQSNDLSPDKKHLAYTIENNLYIANIFDSIVPITTIKNTNIVSGKAIHRFEFGISKGTFWSPNNNQIAFYQKDETDVADYPLLDINSTPGKLNSIKYPMAGQKSEEPQIGVYNIETKSLIYLSIGDNYFDNYLTNLTWGPNSEFIYVAELNREQNHMKLVKYNATNGNRISVLFEEKNEKWVEPEHELFFIPGNENQFLWLSERDGFMNFFLYNTDGKLLKKVTANSWVSTGVLGYNEKIKTLYYSGTGSDPRNMHAFSVSIMETQKSKQITIGNGIHKCQLSPNNEYLLDIHSSIDKGPIVNCISLRKSELYKIHEAKNPLLNFNTATTELIKLKANDGTDLQGRIIKPSRLKKNKKYPVLVYVYGGPHAQMINNGWLAGASLWMHWMAQQGYVVFTLDNRGSSNRGFEFESVIHRNLGTIEIEDQLAGIDFLKKLPYVDTNRFAVHGWSFGGFMTSSLMLRTPGVFNCGVAGGPVTDWKWYEIMYGERYMDKPEENKEGYKTASLLNYASQLEGKLLLIHGTADDVVVMQHNLALVQKCVSEGVQLDFFPYPMHPHNVRGKDRLHLMTKVLNYVFENNE